MGIVSYGGTFDKNVDKNIHYQIVDFYKNGSVNLLLWNSIIFIISFIVFHEYPKMLISLDFAFTVLLALYLLVVKPLMLQGVIPAYYRKDYADLKQLITFLQLLGRGSVLRLITVALYYIITLYLFVGMNKSFDDVKSVMLESIQNSNSWVISFIVSITIVYILFYHEKYVSIQEYNQRVSEIMATTFFSLKGAVTELIYIKDRENEIEKNTVKFKEIQSTYTHSNDSEHVVELKDTQRIFETNSESEMEQPSTLVRRRARR